MLVHASGEVNKYKFESKEINVDTITSFVNDYKSGKLNKYLKSEEPPADNSEPVKVIVGKTFDELVKNSS